MTKRIETEGHTAPEPPEGDAHANLQFLHATLRVLRRRGMSYDEILGAVARIADADAS